MADELELIDIDALIQPVARIRVAGAEHNVLPINGRSVDLLQQVAESARRGNTSVTFLEVAREVVAGSVPSLTPEQLRALGMEQLTMIIGISSKQVERVKRMIAIYEGKESGSESTSSKVKSTTPATPARKSTRR